MTLTISDESLAMVWTKALEVPISLANSYIQQQHKIDLESFVNFKKVEPATPIHGLTVCPGFMCIFRGVLSFSGKEKTHNSTRHRTTFLVIGKNSLYTY